MSTISSASMVTGLLVLKNQLLGSLVFFIVFLFRSTPVRKELPLPAFPVPKELFPEQPQVSLLYG
jgi:hypothetical protein